MLSILIIVLCPFLTLAWTVIDVCDIGDYIVWPAFTTCTLSYLNLISDHKHFMLIPDYPPNEIKGLRIHSSNMEVLTSDICEALPFLTHFLAQEAGVTSIDLNAFQSCTKLKEISVGNSALTNVPSGVFDSNTEVEGIYIWRTKLTEIDEDLFQHNKKLLRVSFANNQLSSLPEKLFRNNPQLQELKLKHNHFSDVSFVQGMPMLKKLTELKLNGNKILDLDPETLIEKFPSLKNLGLSDNDLWCERANEIAVYCRERGVSVETGGCIERREDWEAKRDSYEGEVVPVTVQESSLKQLIEALSVIEGRLAVCEQEKQEVEGRLRGDIEEWL